MALQLTPFIGAKRVFNAEHGRSNRPWLHKAEAKDDRLPHTALYYLLRLRLGRGVSFFQLMRLEAEPHVLYALGSPSEGSLNS